MIRSAFKALTRHHRRGVMGMPVRWCSDGGRHQKQGKDSSSPSSTKETHEGSGKRQKGDPPSSSNEADFLFEDLEPRPTRPHHPASPSKTERPTKGGWTAIGKKASSEEVEEQSTRLKNLWMDKREERRVRRAPGAVFDGYAKEVTVDDEDTLLKPKTTAAKAASPFSFDEDSELTPEPHTDAVALAKTTTQLELVEEELLDDSFQYFAVRGATEGLDPATAPVPSYVPGQQIIPPGLTRYRVEVQYQGGDFDGWFKSSVRRHVKRRVGPDGRVEYVPVEREGSRSGLAGEGVVARYHAKTILEEALAVAFDITSCEVVASVIPEVGVSVRRLTCHVDIPSDVEMQPRTILQRATMWLQKRELPLAILACHPCKNQDFHARHSGVRRVYCYRILNRVAPPLFDAGLQWHVDRHLDVPRMQRFAQAMEGTKDFGYFCDPKMLNALRRAARTNPGRQGAAYQEEHQVFDIQGAPKTDFERGLTHLQRAAALPTFNELGQKVVTYDAKPKQFLKAGTNLPTIRTVDTIRVVRQEDEVLLWFVGQSFLRHQIRHLVSVLKAAGNGLWDEQELQHAFNSGLETSRIKFEKERLPPAPVHGLTLWDVEYPKKYAPDYVPYVDSGPFEEIRVSREN